MEPLIKRCFISSRETLHSGPVSALAFYKPFQFCSTRHLHAPQTVTAVANVQLLLLRDQHYIRFLLSRTNMVALGAELKMCQARNVLAPNHSALQGSAYGLQRNPSKYPRCSSAGCHNSCHSPAFLLTCSSSSSPCLTPQLGGRFPCPPAHIFGGHVPTQRQ